GQVQPAPSDRGGARRDRSFRGPVVALGGVAMGAAAVPVRPETEPRSKKLLERPKPRFGVRLSRRAAVLFVLVCVVLACAVAPFRAYLVQRAQLHALQQQARVLEGQNAALS